MSQPWVPRTEREEAVMDVLVAVRAFSDSMDRMNGGMKGDMDMNVTDLAALRMLIMREQRGTPVSPHDIAEHLRITTASTTKLVDRLVSSGHIERHPHPTDRRSRVLTLTDASRREFYRHFGERLRAMRAVAERYDDEQLRTVVGFLGEMSQAMDPEPVAEKR